MSKTKILRILVNAEMAVLIIPTMSYHITDYMIHEWLGLALFGLFVLHQLLNRNWYEMLFREKYTAISAIIS